MLSSWKVLFLLEVQDPFLIIYSLNLLKNKIILAFFHVLIFQTVKLFEVNLHNSSLPLLNVLHSDHKMWCTIILEIEKRLNSALLYIIIRRVVSFYIKEHPTAVIYALYPGIFATCDLVHFLGQKNKFQIIAPIGKNGDVQWHSFYVESEVIAGYNFSTQPNAHWYNKKEVRKEYILNGTFENKGDSDKYTKHLIYDL